ncbi:hypothetical protein KYX90_13810, partial [Enterococcus lactis]|uniref:hypothetical protein n=1 Tax=Enterococcus lactis TaxID=357441 RepID=UPI001C7D5AD7
AGSLNTEARTSAYTASQWMLLLIPNLYKIAGGLLPSVFHGASRPGTTSALYVFGDHGDVMAASQKGFEVLAERRVTDEKDWA